MPITVCDRLPSFRRMRLVLAYVRQTVESDGRPPSYGMIAETFNISRSDVSKVVRRLERDRYVSRVGAGRVRRIRLLDSKGAGTVDHR